MPIAAGTRLGPYEVISRLGAGGMGEVWRAKDSRLDRSVAIKVLPTEFAENAQLRLRFEREAKTISQLNHPNICTLHDVGHDSGVDFLVLELIDGETVADRLSRGAMPLAEVLRVGSEIASALHRAHRAGIVHRDLKPGNVMLTKSGTKLLDFGLAKSEAAITTADGATVQKQLTEEGTILGTFQYMAPEQLEGADADARTDIFAFGALLYEMATGRRAFEGKTKTSLIAAIVGGEPKPIRSVQPLAPAALQHVIAKCLEKEPDNRWQSAHDVAEELRWISQESEQQAVSPRRKFPTVALALLTLIALLATAAGLYFATAKKQLPAIEAGITPEGSSGLDYNSGPPALSRDGKWLAFSARGNDARRRIWLRKLEGGKPQPIAGTEEGISPFWSPSGDRIAFFANGKLKAISVSGGEADDLAQSDGTGGGTWNEDGVILFAPKGIGGISRISSGGGDEPVAVTTAPDPKFRTHRWPNFLPDGKHFLYLAISNDAQVKPSILVASLDGSEAPREVASSDSNAAYAAGALLTVRNGVLRAQQFDVKAMMVTGEPVTVAPVQRFGWNAGALYAVSGGLLAYQPQGSIELSRLTKKDRSGKALFSSEPAYYWTPRLSHDGKRIAVDKSDETTGAGDIWIVPTDGRTETRLTFEAENETAPVWTADDTAVSYGLFETRLIGSAMIKRLAGGGAQRLFPDSQTGHAVLDLSRDGSLVALVSLNLASTEGRNVVVQSLRDGKSTTLASTPAEEGSPQFSPDARWVAYSSDETGRSEIYVQPFPPTGGKYQVSPQGGRYPRWATQNEIVYLSTDEKLVAVAVETEAGQFRTTPPQLIFPVNLREGGSFAQYDVGSDGTIVLNEIVPREPAPMTLLVNWSERLALPERD